MRTCLSYLLLFGFTLATHMPAFASENDSEIIWLTLCASGEKIPFPFGGTPQDQPHDRSMACHVFCTKDEEVSD